MLNNYHMDVVRTTLTRNIAVRFSDIRDEIITAFSEEIPVSHGVHILSFTLHKFTDVLVFRMDCFTSIGHCHESSLSYHKSVVCRSSLV